MSGGGNDKTAPNAQRNHLGMVVSDGEEDDGGGDSIAGEAELIRVRFVNPPPSKRVDSRVIREGSDVVILTKPGTNILRLGDDHGIKIPRACRTGLCGTW